MVITIISGGVGNQLFQYASARALALRLKTSLRLDTSVYASDPDTKRTFDLRYFRIFAPEATRMEKWMVRRLARPRIARVVAPFCRLGLPLAASAIHEKQHHFEEEINSAMGHVYLHGMRQSERYFSDSADVIRQDLAFRNEPDDANRAMLDHIQSVEAIALHVRRGDYLDRPHIYSTCGLAYYGLAIKYLAERVAHPHFFFFSDDPAWTQENIKVPFPSTYLTHNLGRQDVEDLRLMSHCKHFIIPNSTFSWWGAWLSRNPNKCVVAPRQWFVEGFASSADLVPKGWVRL